MKNSNNLSQSIHISVWQRNYTKMYTIIKELYRCWVREDGERQELVDIKELEIDSIDKLDMKNLIGFYNQSLYYEYLNITNIMKLKRLDFRDIYGIRPNELILTRENILERLMLLITSYFWMGTELRFLKQLCVEGFEESIDAEYWHGKALELSVKFLPGDWPLTKHILASYWKHHSPSYERIPEDSEIDSDVKIIKPLKGIFSNKLTPIIKYIETPSVQLSPLDLDPNDYITDKIHKLQYKSTENSQKEPTNLNCLTTLETHNDSKSPINMILKSLENKVPLLHISLYPLPIDKSKRHAPDDFKRYFIKTQTGTSRIHIFIMPNKAQQQFKQD